MEIMGNMPTSIVLDGISAVLEKRKLEAVHRKVAPELVERGSTRKLHGA